MGNRGFIVMLVLLLSGPLALSESNIDPGTGLKIAAGWELVRAHCGACHSHKLVTSQRADRQTWLDIIRWMQSTQNLWPFDATTESTILDYLAKNYPPQPGRRRAPIRPGLMPPTTSFSVPSG